MEKKMAPGSSIALIAGLSFGAWAIIAAMAFALLALLGVI